MKDLSKVYVPPQAQILLVVIGELVDLKRVGPVVLVLIDVGKLRVEAALTSDRTRGSSYEPVELKRHMFLLGLW